MRLLPKLTLGVIAASAVPLGIAGFTSARLSETALRRRIQQDHAALAVNAADGVNRFFDGVADALAVLPRLRPDLDGAPPEVATGVLRVAYRQHEDLAIVSLLDESGAEHTPSAYVSDPESLREIGDHPLVSDEDRDAFLARAPVAQALARGVAIGPVVMVGHPPEPRLALAVSFEGKGGRFVIAADVSLRRLHRRLGELSIGGTEVVLVDAQRRGVAGGGRGRAPLQGVALPGDKDPTGAPPRQTVVDTVTPRGRAPLLAAFAPAGATGFGVIVMQPEAAAFAHVSGLRQRTLYWLGISALVALVVGVGLARSVSRRIGALSDGTVTIAQGRFDTRLDATGSDELAALARSFNKMAADLGTAADEIRRRNEEITKKNEEITRWNQELERRVEKKTRELRQAEELLLRSRSLAAIGTLGAGMAHEINNPLTGVLGSAQLLLLELPHGSSSWAMVKDIEQQAQRIRQIVSNLLRLAQRESGDELVSVDLNRVIDDALDLVGREELKRARIEVDRRLTEPLPPVRGNPVQLQEAVIELMTNARRAMPEGGRLLIETKAPDPRVVYVRVADTGRGIEPAVVDKIFDPFFTTKDNWQSTGMGLTLVHKIVEEHKGTIQVDTQVGRGAAFVLTFPSAAARAHLE